MRRGVRTILFWLLAFALPLQGLAGPFMHDCVSTPAEARGAAANSSLRGAVAIDRAAAGGDHAHSSPVGCAGGAACGLVGASAAIAPMALPSMLGTAPSLARPSPRVGFLTGAPDRPPRLPA